MYMVEDLQGRIFYYNTYREAKEHQKNNGGYIVKLESELKNEK